MAAPQSATGPRLSNRTADGLEAHQERRAAFARRAHFDLFLTCDQNLRYQQALTGRSIAILELSTNKLRRLQAAAQLIRETLASMQLAEFQRLEIPM